MCSSTHASTWLGIGLKEKQYVCTYVRTYVCTYVLCMYICNYINYILSILHYITRLQKKQKSVVEWATEVESWSGGQAEHFTLGHGHASFDYYQLLSVSLSFYQVFESF